MVSFKYSTTVTEHMAKASLRAEPISTKHSIEICNMIRGMPLSRAKTLLTDVVAMKKPVPFKRFNDNVGHRKGMGPGRYPTKAASKILDLLNGVTANAQVKGLDTDALLIKHINSHYASRPMRAGRHRGRVSKRTHVEIVVEESAKLKVDRKPKKTTEQKKEVVKSDVKEPVKSDKTKKTESVKNDSVKTDAKLTEEKTKTVEQPKKVESVEEKKDVKKEIKTDAKEDVKKDEKTVVQDDQKEIKKDDKESVKKEKDVEKETDNSNNSKGAKND